MLQYRIHSMCNLHRRAGGRKPNHSDCREPKYKHFTLMNIQPGRVSRRLILLLSASSMVQLTADVNNPIKLCIQVHATSSSGFTTLHFYSVKLLIPVNLHESTF